MKKLLTVFLFSICILNSYSNEIPREIKNLIISEARTMFDNGRERNEFIKWQEESYLELEKSLTESNLSLEEQNRIRVYLRGTYGSNFLKQNGEVGTEISRVVNTEIMIQNSVQEELSKKLEQENLELETRNLESQKNLEKIVSSPEIPPQLMTRFKSEAERLYPNNFYEQERYIESSVANFKFYKNIK